MPDASTPPASRTLHRSVEIHVAALFNGEDLAIARDLLQSWYGYGGRIGAEEVHHAALLLSGSDLDALSRNMDDDWRDLIVASGIRTTEGLLRLEERGVRWSDLGYRGGWFARFMRRIGAPLDAATRRLSRPAGRVRGKLDRGLDNLENATPPEPLPLGRRLLVATCAIGAALFGGFGYAMFHTLTTESGTSLDGTWFAVSILGTMVVVGCVLIAREFRRARRSPSD